jgi:hypothetical protein
LVVRAVAFINRLTSRRSVGLSGAWYEEKRSFVVADGGAGTSPRSIASNCVSSPR